MAQSNFVDYVKIFCHSGKGGSGSKHFFRSKHNATGGPDGGDGGNGGSIILRAVPQKWTLLHLKYTKHISAGDGGNGGSVILEADPQLSSLIDSIATQLQSDSIAEQEEQRRSDVERAKERMRRDEIFVMNIKPARSNYMFGIELNLFNCYDKTISMLELSVAPYNDRDRVQEDKFHRSVRSMRCMGPIRPGQPAQYTFDELFWDDSGRIKYMRVTHITFHFTDGTSLSFNGYKQILRHSLK